MGSPHLPAWFPPAWLALVLGALLPACGGTQAEGTAPATPAVADPGVAAPGAVTLAPTVLDARANTRVTVRGRDFVAPARLRFLDERDLLLGSEMSGDVREGGTRVDSAAPLLPDVSGEILARCELTLGDGRVLRVPGTVRFTARAADARTIDGSGNNSSAPTMGRAGEALREDVGRAYGDDVSSPAGAGRPSARLVSNLVCAAEGDVPNTRGATDMFWLWGQFLDHDVDLTPEAVPAESFPVAIPSGDPWFDPDATGSASLPFRRSTWLPDTGTDPSRPRRQSNEISAWIDASNVYGSDAARATALRAQDGTGRLRTSAGDLLPFNTQALPNAPSAFAPNFFLAGDVRANENVGLTSLHTLFVREHNRLADGLRARNPHLEEDEVYEAARREVGALVQVVTYREFLPLLLGPDALAPYAGYDPELDAAVGVGFSTASYRFGHSLVSGTLWRLDAQGAMIPEGPLALRDAFFHPEVLVEEGGIEPVLRGFAAHVAQELDALVVDDLRNFLFGAPGQGGLDLAALNVQRGRDHGLPGYNACRAALRLVPRATLAEVSRDPLVVERLEAAYGSVDEVDAWVGALCEDRVPGAMVGELLRAALSDQFRRLRDGDRHWYQRVHAGEDLARLEATRLSDVIRRNTGIGAELPDSVMVTGPAAPLSTGGQGGAGRPPRPPAQMRDALTNRFFR